MASTWPKILTLRVKSCQCCYNVHKTGCRTQNPICGMLINSVASLMSLTLSTGQTRLMRAPPLRLAQRTCDPSVLSSPGGFPGTGQAQCHRPHPSPIPWAPQLPHSTQRRVYYTMSRVNQGSINAKSAAGLTYPTQLLTLNTRPRQQMGRGQGNINEALCGLCSACAGLCAQGPAGVRSMGVGVGSTLAPRCRG